MIEQSIEELIEAMISDPSAWARNYSESLMLIDKLERANKDLAEENLNLKELNIYLVAKTQSHMSHGDH